MRVPLSLTASMAGYLTRKGLSGDKKYPLVMMLEPLHACNLTCTGCGRIREYKSTINESLTVEQCLKGVDECGAFSSILLRMDYSTSFSREGVWASLSHPYFPQLTPHRRRCYHRD